MAAWAGVLALTGFHYSGVELSMQFAKKAGHHFWSNGSAWGTVEIQEGEDGWQAKLNLLWGELSLRHFGLGDRRLNLARTTPMRRNDSYIFQLPK